jgi:hypothetical protein
VKILVELPEGLTLRPGMNVDATIFTKQNAFSPAY